MEVVIINTKDYLSQLKNIDKRIKYLLKEADRWHDIATSTSGASLDSVKVQTTPNPDRIGEVVSKIVDYQRKCLELANEKVELRHTIIEQINSLGGKQNDTYCNILYGFYVEKKQFGELAGDNSMSYSQTRRYYNAAIRKFEEMFGSLYLDAESIAKKSKMAKNEQK